MDLGVAAARNLGFQARAVAMTAPAWPNFGRDVTRVKLAIVV